jgi:hypothetical protein
MVASVEVHQANLTSLDFSIIFFLLGDILLSYWINSINWTKGSDGNEVIENE